MLRHSHCCKNLKSRLRESSGLLVTLSRPETGISWVCQECCHYNYLLGDVSNKAILCIFKVNKSLIVKHEG
jgi:hypothetical protein